MGSGSDSAAVPARLTAGEVRAVPRSGHGQIDAELGDRVRFPDAADLDLDPDVVGDERGKCFNSRPRIVVVVITETALPQPRLPRKGLGLLEVRYYTGVDREQASSVSHFIPSLFSYFFHVTWIC